MKSNDHLLSIEPLETHFNRNFLQEIENVVCKTAALLIFSNTRGLFCNMD